MKRISFLVVAAVCLMVALTVQSAPRPTGAIKVPAYLVLDLKIDNKPVTVPSGREVTMPAATYTPACITAQAAAPGKTKAEIWSIKCTGPFGNVASIEVQQGATSAIDAGPPLTLKPIIYAVTNSPQGKVIPIGLAIIGKADEYYAANSLKKGMSSVPPPQFQILDETGKVLTQGAFEYG